MTWNLLQVDEDDDEGPPGRSNDVNDSDNNIDNNVPINEDLFIEDGLEDLDIEDSDSEDWKNFYFSDICAFSIRVSLLWDEIIHVTNSQMRISR